MLLTARIDAIPKKRGPKTDVLEALLTRVNGLEKRLKDEDKDKPASPDASDRTADAATDDNQTLNASIEAQPPPTDFLPPKPAMPPSVPDEQRQLPQQELLPHPALPRSSTDMHRKRTEHFPPPLIPSFAPMIPPVNVPR